MKTPDTLSVPAEGVDVPWRNPRLTGRIPELDGLRGLAILLVVFYHYLILTVRALQCDPIRTTSP